MTVDAPETVEVTKTEVHCDGGSNIYNCAGVEGADPLGHPTVFLKIGPKGWVECPYCDRKFVIGDGVTIHQN